MNLNSLPVTRNDQMEIHRSGRTGWLRAALLGAEDAIVPLPGQ
jgi:hypothetical protein